MFHNNDWNPGSVLVFLSLLILSLSYFSSLSTISIGQSHTFLISFLTCCLCHVFLQLYLTTSLFYFLTRFFFPLKWNLIMLLQGLYAVAFIYPQGKVLIIMVCVCIYVYNYYYIIVIVQLFHDFMFLYLLFTHLKCLVQFYTLDRFPRTT